MEHKENMIAILNLWEQAKKPALGLAGALKEIHTAFIIPAGKRRRQYMAAEDSRTELLLRQQEREVKGIEGNPDIYNHGRRQGSRADEAF